VPRRKGDAPACLAQRLLTVRADMATVPLSLVRRPLLPPEESPSELSAPRWVGDVGAALWPLVAPLDRVLVVPVKPSELVPGDLALVRSPDKRLLAQVVRGSVPLCYAGLLGRRPPPDVSLLGRIIAIRRGEQVQRVSVTLRPLWAELARLTSGARHHDALTAAVRNARQVATSSYTLPLRRLALAPLTIRLLVPGDVEAVAGFAAKHLVISPELLRRRLAGRWQKEGAGVGAFARNGRLVGFAFLDNYQDQGLDIVGSWIRSVFVLPLARGLGLAQALIALLCEAGAQRRMTAIRAAIERDNAASLTAFARQGFLAVDAATNEELNRAWRAAGSSRQWTIVERRI
jgi:L-amino acid N-acyltransferase YncA